MKIVSNSSPICYLRLIDRIHLLPALFGKIFIPEAVVQELSNEAPLKLFENGWSNRLRGWRSKAQYIIWNSF